MLGGENGSHLTILQGGVKDPNFKKAGKGSSCFCCCSRGTDGSLLGLKFFAGDLLHYQFHRT